MKLRCRHEEVREMVHDDADMYTEYVDALPSVRIRHQVCEGIPMEFTGSIMLEMYEQIRKLGKHE